MSFGVTETYLILPRSWRRAEQCSAVGSRIGPAVMEESAIEFWDSQHTIQYCNFMNNIPLVMNLIPLDSWHRAQEPPGVRFRIDCLGVVECCSCGTGVWILSVVMKRVCCVASSLRLRAEKPPGLQALLDLRL